MKVLITVPRLSMPGGVASYFCALRPVLGRDKTYFEVGRTGDEIGVWSVLKRLVVDCMNFAKQLIRIQYDLVHINPSLLRGAMLRDGLLLLVARMARKPVVVMFHGWDKDCERIVEYRLLWLFRLVFGQAAGFVVLADEFRDTLRRWSGAQLIFVETTVVDDGAMASEHKVVHAKRRASPTFNVLFLARLERAKGIYETLDAFALLRKRVSRARLIVAGDGPDRGLAENYLRTKGIGDVEFVGFVRERQKADIFSSAHVYVFPTYGEGMPTSVLEAMAYGLPVITRPVGGLRDFFENGRMGYLTDSLDPRVFAELTEKLANDVRQRETMGEYNRRYAEERFAASKVAARVEGIYASIVAGGGVSQTHLSGGQSCDIRSV